MRLIWITVCAAAAATVSTSGNALDLSANSGAARDCPSAGYGIAFTASVIAYLEPAPVVDVGNYGGSQYSPSQGHNVGLGIGYGEATAAAAGFCVGALYRAEYRANATRDLLDILVANHYGNPFNANRTYQLYLDEKSFKADGIRLRKIWNIDPTDTWSFKLGIAASLLKGLEGKEEDLTGSVIATSNNYAVGTALLRQTASDLSLTNFNPFVAPGSAYAHGFATDVELIAKSTHGWSIDLVVVDAIARLYWHDIPQSLRTLNNSAISYNANFDRDAFVSGLDSRINYTQDLSPKYHVVVSHPLVSSVNAFVEDDFVDGLHFPSLGGRYGTDTRNTELNYDFRTNAVGIGGRLGFIRALLTTNNIHWRNATVLGISLQASHSW
jgi:hypothetical protein